MTAEALAQSGVQQVGGGVVALGGAPRRAIHAREHGLLGVQRAALQHDVEHLIVAEANHALNARAAVPVLAFDRAGVRYLPAASGIEGRLGELDQAAARIAGVVPAGADGGGLGLGLIAGEARGEAGGGGELAGAFAGIGPVAVTRARAARRRAGTGALGVHETVELGRSSTRARTRRAARASDRTESRTCRAGWNASAAADRLSAGGARREISSSSSRVPCSSVRPKPSSSEASQRSIGSRWSMSSG